MGINVKMTGWEVDCYGEIIDPDDLVYEFVRPYATDPESNFLRYIYPHGAYFNSAQIVDFIKELKPAIRREKRDNVRAVGVQIFLLALNHMKEGNTYLEFIGD